MQLKPALSYDDQVERLINFHSLEISDEDKDAASEAIIRAHWETKRENKKYGYKKKDWVIL